MDSIQKHALLAIIREYMELHRETISKHGLEDEYTDLIRAVFEDCGYRTAKGV